MKKIVLLDDTQTGCDFLLELLGEKYPGLFELYQTYSISEFSQLIEKFDDGAIFVIGLYLSSGPDDGLEYIRDLRKAGNKNPIFVWSKLAYVYRRKAHNAGADKVFEKFVEDEKLLKAIMNEPYIDDDEAQMKAYDLQSQKDRKKFRYMLLIMSPFLVLDLLVLMIYSFPLWGWFFYMFIG
jgi:CheY-like chemotaxis protein